MLLLALAGKLQLFVSESILDEYHEVLYRPKFGIAHHRLDRLLALMKGAAQLIKPTRKLSVSPDLPDNRFLECAETAEADDLVTGNKRHFPRVWEKTKVVTARELIKIITPGLQR